MRIVCRTTIGERLSWFEAWRGDPATITTEFRALPHTGLDPHPEFPVPPNGASPELRGHMERMYQQKVQQWHKRARE